jgi:hypothetical protein
MRTESSRALVNACAAARGRGCTVADAVALAFGSHRFSAPSESMATLYVSSPLVVRVRPKLPVTSATTS